jgi:hypothetical protein
VGNKKTQLTENQLTGLSICDLGGILTPDRWSRNPVLYTAELRSLIVREIDFSLSDKVNTAICILQDCCKRIKDCYISNYRNQRRALKNVFDFSGLSSKIN